MSTEKKTVTLGVPTVKTRSAFDVMEQTGGGFIVKRNAKSPCWYLRHQIRYISGFSIFKGSSKPDPIQTIRQSLFSIWDYTFSLRVKVMKVTEHTVCKI